MVPLGVLGVVDHLGLVCLLSKLKHSIRVGLPDHVGLDQILGLDQVDMEDKIVLVSKASCRSTSQAA